MTATAPVWVSKWILMGFPAQDGKCQRSLAKLTDNKQQEHKLSRSCPGHLPAVNPQPGQPCSGRRPGIPRGSQHRAEVRGCPVLWCWAPVPCWTPPRHGYKQHWDTTGIKPRHGKSPAVWLQPQQRCKAVLPSPRRSTTPRLTLSDELR